MAGRKLAPGVLSYQQLRTAVRLGLIKSKEPLEERQFQPASLDLRLGEKAYRVVASFLPKDAKVIKGVEASPVLDMYEPDLVMYTVDLRGGAVLEKGCVYLVPLMESLKLPPGVQGRTNPKSTTGRLDIFTRVITDYNPRFDEIREGYRGPLYLEVVPRSFSAKVKSGMSLNQLRLIVGDCAVSDSELADLHERVPLVYSDGGRALPLSDVRINDGLFMRVDLLGKETKAVIGFKSKKNSQVIDLSNVDYYDPLDFWEQIYAHTKEALILEPEDFYILGSKERVRVPPDFAAEMVAYDAGSGELRSHYAGFFDSGFGFGRGELLGTRVVMEVRAREVPFLVYDGQTFFRVKFEKMSTRPKKVYGELGSSYQQQSLTLSKHFRRSYLP